MKRKWEKLAAEVIASLSANEREASISYLEQRVFTAGEALPWDEVDQCFEEPVVIAFVDLEPALNWTHRARYVVLGADGGIRRITDANRPPFMTGVSPDLRLIHRGSQAPRWAVMTFAKLP